MWGILLSLFDRILSYWKDLKRAREIKSIKTGVDENIGLTKNHIEDTRRHDQKQEEHFQKIEAHLESMQAPRKFFLASLVLAGGWDGKKKVDRELVSALMEQPYDNNFKTQLLSLIKESRIVQVDNEIY